MDKPVIFLCFANARGNDLKNLKAEEAEIRQSLSPLHAFGFLDFISQGKTTIDDLFSTLNNYQNRLAIFHYGGHAGASILDLEDQPAQAEGIAERLGSEKNLQLVFLNGCSTKEQVELLWKNNVKAVIATEAPIDDQLAMDFSVYFYRSLATRRSIENSFKDAVARLKTEGRMREEGIGLYFRSAEIFPEPPKPGHFPWGMFVQDESVLEWTIPLPTFEELHSDKARAVMTQHGKMVFDINEMQNKLAFEDNIILSEELKSLKNNWMTLNKVLTNLRDSVALEDSPLRKMQLEKQIEEREIMSEGIKDRMDNIKKQM